MIAWFTGTKIGQWVAKAVAAVALLFGIWFAGRQTGKSTATEKVKRKDAERALDKKEKADAALRDRDTARPVDERLREHGRLRD